MTLFMNEKKKKYNKIMHKAFIFFREMEKKCKI